MKTQSFTGSKVIAGEKGLGRTVALFGMLDAPDSIDLVKPDEFIITTGFSIRENHILQLDIVRRLHEKKAAGLGIKMNRYIREFSQDILDFANACEFPIVSLPNSSTFYDLSSSIFFLKANTSEKHADALAEERTLFLRQLITSPPSAEVMSVRAERAGLDFSGCYAVLLVESRTQDGARANRSMPPVLVKALQRFANRFSYPHHRISNGLLCLLVPLTTDDFSSNATRKHLCEIIARIRKDLEEGRHEWTVSIFAGAVAGSLFDVMRSYQTARIARAVENCDEQADEKDSGDIGGSFDRFYADLTVYCFLFNNIDAVTRAAYIDRYISPLVNAKGRADSDLLATLTAFLRSNRSNRKCAREMYLHENTIIYRMKKIQKICNLDFNKADDLLLIEAVVKLYEISQILSDDA